MVQCNIQCHSNSSHNCKSHSTCNHVLVIILACYTLSRSSQHDCALWQAELAIKGFFFQPSEILYMCVFIARQMFIIITPVPFLNFHGKYSYFSVSPISECFHEGRRSFNYLSKSTPNGWISKHARDFLLGLAQLVKFQLDLMMHDQLIIKVNYKIAYIRDA